MQLIYRVSWRDEDTGLFAYKDYKHKGGAYKFVNGLPYDCKITVYTEFGDKISETTVLKGSDDHDGLPTEVSAL